MSSFAASPMKLRNGSWGAKAQSADVSVGDTLTITTRAGKSWDAQVDRVLWTGDDEAICATSSLDRAPRRKRGGCDCDAECCQSRCHCDSHCVCRGGNIYDC